MIQPESFLLLISSTLFLCYLSGLIYTKTKIPDILWLLGFGILLGPVMGVFDKAGFVAISPLMGVIAICIITFDSGITLDFKVLKKTIAKSLALTLATFFTVVFTVGFVISFLVPESFDMTRGMLLGTMVAGISTVSVSSLMDGLKRLIPNLESANAILSLESTLCDPIRVVAAITLIRMIMLPEVSLRESARDIIYTFVVGSVIGLIVGFVWAEVLDRLRGRSFNYMMTLAALFPTYFLAEMTAGDGGGTMATFIFGLVLSNYRQIAKELGIEKSVRPDKKKLIEFNEEITFLIKSYYFVYIGLIVTISQQYLLLGLTLVALLITVRYVVASKIGSFFRFTREERVISRVVYALGTSTLVMSQLPIIFDPEMKYIANPGIYTDLCFPLILGTVIFAAIVSPMIAKRQLKVEYLTATATVRKKY